MDKNFTYEWIGSDIVVTFYGDISFMDIVQANGVIFRDPRFNKMKFQIFDYSMIKSVDLSDDIAGIITKLDTAATIWNPRIKVATVTIDDVLREKIEEYNKYMESSSWVAKTFNNKHDAVLWCNEE